MWKHSPLDAFLLALSLLQTALMASLAARWDHAGLLERMGGTALLTGAMTYNIIVISHLFTHVPWFESRRLNGAVSLLNSLNIGQSVQAYQLTHVRNHHRYNNDRGADGVTRDTSSTFRGGGGEHVSLFRYAAIGALESALKTARTLASVHRLWAVAPDDSLRELATKEPARHAQELRQVRLDRIAHLVGLVALAALSWRWVLFAWVPAHVVALALVNVQNYYEHYGAAPGSRYTDSVSHYGRLYNLLTFNDGYHQEHHLRPQAHWRAMPEVRSTHAAKLDAVERIVSPFPSIVGFLDRRRPLLHRRAPSVAAEPESLDDVG